MKKKIKKTKNEKILKRWKKIKKLKVDGRSEGKKNRKNTRKEQITWKLCNSLPMKIILCRDSSQIGIAVIDCYDSKKKINKKKLEKNK